MSLADIAESVRYGYTASASDSEVGPKFLRITDIVPPQIDWVNVPYCEIDEKNLTKFSLEPDDIVIARTGATVGYAKLIRDNEPSVFASYLVRIRVDPEKADPGYVGRIVESEVYKRFVLSRVGGAAQPNANAKVLSSFRLPIPEKATQRRIASILSAYDDLIENNRRRIQLLEQAARLLYREWFIHLRFPGHEHVTITDGVPEGWEKGIVADFFDTTSGGTPSRKRPEFFEGDTNWVKTQELNEDFIFETEEKITTEALSKSSAKLFSSGTLLVSIYGGTNIGRTGILAMPSASNQACVALFPRHPFSNFIFAQLFFQNIRETLIGIAQGSAQTNISQQILRKVPMLMPSKTLMQNFLAALAPVYDQLKNLKLQNMRLEESRDLLLPRLVNGEVAV
jgi:type I restriction enzyme S subunit